MLSNAVFGGLRAIFAPSGPARTRPSRWPGRPTSRLARFEPLEDRRLLSVAPEWVIGVTTSTLPWEDWSAAVGPNGDVYVAGTFYDTVDLDPNSVHPGDLDILTSPGGVGDYDGFVAKYTSGGEFLWAASLGSTSNTQDSGTGIDVDRYDNAYVCGRVTGTADFGGGTIGPGAFVTRLDLNGNFDWAVSATTDVRAWSSDITVDDTAADPTDWSVYVGGSFDGTGQIGDQPVHTQEYESDGFVLKLKAAEATGGDSQFVWTRTISGKGGELPESIALDEGGGNLYVAGSFAKRAVFGDLSLTAASYRGLVAADIFVTKMHSDGNFLWAERMGGVGSDVGRGIAVDGGNAYVTGYFGYDNFDIYGPEAKTAKFGDFTLTAAGWNGLFVEKIDPDGNVLWAQQVSVEGTEDFARGSDIAVGADHDIFLTGDFGGTAVFPNSQGPDIEFTSSEGGWSAFVAQIDTLGDFDAAWEVHGEDAGPYASGVTVDTAGNVYATGGFYGTVAFPTGDVLTENDHGMYLLKFAAVPEPPGISVTPTSGLVTSEDGGTAEFTVVLDAEPTGEVTIGITSNDESEGTVSAASLVFDSTNWAQPQTVTVTGVDDAQVDGDVSYSIVLDPATSTDPDYAALDPADVSVTNLDNDGAPPASSLAINDVSKKEGNSGDTIFTFTVTRTGDLSGTVSVVYATADGTALVSENDYQAAADTLTFNPGETSKMIDVTVNGDSVYEPHEAFFVNLSNPTGGATIADDQGIGTIRNDDRRPKGGSAKSSSVLASPTAETADELFASDGPAVDFAELLVDDRLFPASSKRQGKRSSVDLALEEITADPFDQQLAEDLAPALV